MGRIFDLKIPSISLCLCPTPAKYLGLKKSKVEHGDTDRTENYCNPGEGR